jgi:branched-chain amino acid transport system substrate-binding protein
LHILHDVAKSASKPQRQKGVGLRSTSLTTCSRTNHEEFGQMVSLRTAVVVFSILSAGEVCAADKVKVGFVATLSGPLSLLGEEQKRGLTIAMEHLGNKLGGLPAEIMSVDTKGNPSIAVQEVSKLIDKDQVQLLTGVSLSNETMALVQPVAAAKTPLIGTAGGPTPLAGAQCNAYYFNISNQNDQLSEALGAYLSRQGVKSVSLIAMDYQWGWDQAAGFKRNYSGKVVGEKFTPLAQVDYAADLAQLRAQRADAVVAFYAGGPGIAFVKQYGQSGLKTQMPLYSHPGTIDTFAFGALGDAALDVVITNFVSASLDTPLNKKFVADYRAKHTRAPSALAFTQYDAMMLIDASVKDLKGDFSNKDRVIDVLRSVKFPTVRESLRFNNAHMAVQNFYAQKVVKSASGEMNLQVTETVGRDVSDPGAAACPLK